MQTVKHISSGPRCNTAALATTAVVAALVCAVAVFAITHWQLNTTVYYTCCATAGVAGMASVILSVKACSRFFADKNTVSDHLVDDQDADHLQHAPPAHSDAPRAEEDLNAGASLHEEEIPERPAPVPEENNLAAAAPAAEVEEHQDEDVEGADGDDSDAGHHQAAFSPEAPLQPEVQLQDGGAHHFTALQVSLLPTGGAATAAVVVMDSGYGTGAAAMSPENMDDLVNAAGTADSPPGARGGNVNLTKFHDNLRVFKSRPALTMAAAGVGRYVTKKVVQGGVKVSKRVWLGDPVPGRIQKRLYKHLLEGLLDAFYLTCPNARKGTALVMQAEELPRLLMRDARDGEGQVYGFDFRSIEDNLARKGIEETSLDAVTLKILQLLISVGQRGHREDDYATLRENLFDLMDQAYLTEEYKQYLIQGNQTPSVKILQRMGYLMFAAVSVQDYAADVLKEKVVARSEPQRYNHADPVALLNQEQRVIETLPNEAKGNQSFCYVNKMKGHANVDFSPISGNNFPHYLANLRLQRGEQQREVRLLRFGTPTQQDGKEVALKGAFLLFLDYCKEHRQSILSVQLQNRDPGMEHNGDESFRVELMLQLAASDSRYADIYQPLALPHDDNFYKHKKEYDPDLRDAAAFKRVFLERIFGVSREADGRSHFKLPLPRSIQEQIVRDGRVFDERHPIAQDISYILNRVHEVFYANKAELTPKERHVFQNQVYAYLIIYFTEYHQTSFLHGQCKDAMDRAMALVGLMLYNSLVQLGQHGDSGKMQEWLDMVETPALFIKGIPMHGSRYKTLTDCLALSFKVAQEQSQDGGQVLRDMVRVRGEPVGVADIKPAESCGIQHLERIPSEAGNEQEYTQMIRQLAKPNLAKPLFSKHLTVAPSSDLRPVFLQQEMRKDVERFTCYLYDGKPLEMEEFFERFMLKEDKWSEASRHKLSAPQLGQMEKFLPRLKALLMEIKAATGQFPADPNLLDWILKARENISPNDKQEFVNAFQEVYFHAVLEKTEECPEVRQFLYQSTGAIAAATTFSFYQGMHEGALPPFQYQAQEADSIKHPHRNLRSPYYNIVKIQDRYVVEGYMLHTLNHDERGKYYILSRVRIDPRTYEATAEVFPPVSQPPAHYRLFGGGSTEALHGQDGLDVGAELLD
ncbi:MAG: hypothetical protein JSS62_06730 [Verrucomicrobia bacterium]|nr:hypothetical protein [Verrucomicrobiota bacterium]MBS0645899.1 hypothetical protein [Verrucomicrobiota bacterium]